MNGLASEGYSGTISNMPFRFVGNGVLYLYSTLSCIPLKKPNRSILTIYNTLLIVLKLI